MKSAIVRTVLIGMIVMVNVMEFKCECGECFDEEQVKWEVDEDKFDYYTKREYYAICPACGEYMEEV